MTSYSRQLAAFAANLKLSEVSPEAVRHAKGIILNGLGCELLAAHVRRTEIIAKTVPKIEQKGWHSPAICASFPDVITIALIPGLHSDKLYHALGIASTRAFALMAAQLGSSVKRMKYANNAQSGLYAMLLAVEGLTGIEDVFEVEYGGFCSTLTQSEVCFELSELTVGLDERWETMRNDIKSSPVLCVNSSLTDTVADLVKEDSVETDDINAIIVKATEDRIIHGCWEFEPIELTAAQMNVGLGIAMQVIEDRTVVDEMLEAKVTRPDLVALASCVTGARDWAREAMPAKFHRRAEEIRLKDGQSVPKDCDFVLGCHRRSFGDEQILDKICHLGLKTFEVTLNRIKEIIRPLEMVGALTEPSALLSNDQGAPSCRGLAA
jgi:2-methylcitrate dehydratase PrpD